MTASARRVAAWTSMAALLAVATGCAGQGQPSATGSSAPPTAEESVTTPSAEETGGSTPADSGGDESPPAVLTSPPTFSACAPAVFLDEVIGRSTTLDTSEVDPRTGIPHCVYSMPGVQFVINDWTNISPTLDAQRAIAHSNGAEITETPQLGVGAFRYASDLPPGGSLCAQLLPGPDDRVVIAAVTGFGDEFSTSVTCRWVDALMSVTYQGDVHGD